MCLLDGAHGATYQIVLIGRLFRLGSFLGWIHHGKYGHGRNAQGYRIAGGFLAYLFIFAMPLFQAYKMRGVISNRTYSILETIFVYYVWLVFFLTYLPRVQGKLPQAGGSFAEHVALLGWVSTLLGMKLSAMIQFQKKNVN